MKTVAKTALYIAVVAGLAFAGDIAYAAHYASVVAAATGQDTGVDWRNICALVGVIGAFLGVVSTALHIIAPRTQNKVDDRASEELDRALEFLRSAEFEDLKRFVRGNVAPSVSASRSDGTVAIRSADMAVRP